MSDRPLVAVLDDGIGNLRSAQKAREKVGAHARLTAVVAQGQLWTTQFHPEKSATNGLRLLEAFVATTA